MWVNINGIWKEEFKSDISENPKILTTKSQRVSISGEGYKNGIIADKLSGIEIGTVCILIELNPLQQTVVQFISKRLSNNTYNSVFAPANTADQICYLIPLGNPLN